MMFEGLTPNKPVSILMVIVVYNSFWSTMEVYSTEEYAISGFGYTGNT